MQTEVLSPESGIVGRSFLRRILMVDGTVSALGGIGFILAAEPLARFMNIPSPVAVEGIGVVCLAFALLVGFTTRQMPIKRNWAALIVLLNAIGEILCDAVLLFDPFRLSSGGKLAILALAVDMTVLGIAEWYGLRRDQPLSSRT